MQANRGRDTKPELALRRALFALGLRYRVQMKIVSGTQRRVDVVFTRSRVAVFVDGCFWHGCPTHGTRAKANGEFWNDKITSNRARDADTNARLGAAGWRVMRFWEHEDMLVAAHQVAEAVKAPLEFSSSSD